jgi:HEAT repeat protein
MTGRLSAPTLALLAIGLAALWLAVASTTRAPYMALLRRTFARDAATPSSMPEALDLASVETLVEYLSHENPLVVVGAMNALARRGRTRLVPTLMLLHENEAVVVRALALHGASERQEWTARARRLLTDRREPVRTAAARALAVHGQLSTADLAQETSPRLRSYAALWLALESEGSLLDHPEVASVLRETGSDGLERRLGLLSAMADAPPSDRLAQALERIAADGVTARLEVREFARAAGSQRAPNLVPALVSRLAIRDAREAVRTALLSFGDMPLDELARALSDAGSPRALRIHLPDTVARFGTKRAAELLLLTIEGDPDGLVRYKAIRALGRLVAEHRLKLDRRRVEKLALANLEEYFRLLALRVPLDPQPLHLPTGGRGSEPEARILVGLLNDKLRQSLERTFRLLKVAYPDEDIHQVHLAYLSGDAAARANAAEFLAVFLRRRDQRRLGELLRIGAEEALPADALGRARAWLGESGPLGVDEALERMTRDRDATLAGLARLRIGAMVGERVQRISPLSDADRKVGGAEPKTRGRRASA